MPAARNKKSAEKAWLKECLAAFPKLLEGYERDHPQWQFEVLYWLLDRALRSLQGYLASSEETENTWASPYVEIHFPVDCVWSETSTVGEPSFTLQSEHLSTAAAENSVGRNLDDVEWHSLIGTNILNILSFLNLSGLAH